MIPAAHRSDFAEQRFGITVRDPYRWMEDAAAPDTARFVEQHNARADAHIPRDLVDHYAARVRANFARSTYTAPQKYGDWWWWKYTDHVTDRNHFVRSKDYADASPQVCVTVENFGANKSCEFYGCDHSGRYWVGGVQTNGSDWQEVRIFDADAQAFLDDTLADVKFTFRYPFTRDNAGFFYHRLPASEHGSTGSYGALSVYFHRLHTPQADDLLVWSNDTNFPIAEHVTEDGRHMVFTAAEGVDPQFSAYYVELDALLAGRPRFEPIDDSASCSYFFQRTWRGKWLFLSNRGAPRNCIIAWSAETGFETVVPEHDDILKYAVPVGDKLMLVYMHDAADVVRLWSPAGLEDVAGTGFSSVRLYSGSPDDATGFLELEGYDQPVSVYAVDSATSRAVRVRGDAQGQDADFRCERVSFASFDGQQVGMFVAWYQSRRRPDPPVLLYAYGGFNVAEEPRHEPLWTTFMRDMGGVLCVANIRGGGEYGLDWWESARGVKRQVGWNDFKAAARYIVDSGLTTRDRLVANGISNGGLLVSACTMQSPELFGCVISDVGIHDLPRFDQFTFGHLWKGEYGDPGKREDYEILLKTSPYANVPACELPAMLFTTADNDDRVVPAHSLKMAAEVLHKNPHNTKPVVLRMFKGTGHMMGKTTQMVVYESSEKLAFIHSVLGL